ncbi:hypothetical protein GGR28_001837 [Lewinella aquimaris]|uniref:2TM domain-containing protein n=1 Tax=Neolewinella aquimaris TaxID=1835722 RepID=A0A840E7I8_9BACT|nr:2TM domain-containing protein [Neolewinella aquimaris]MBB4079217.1 hypothetical protein [Neolewinella aquimaris]
MSRRKQRQYDQKSLREKKIDFRRHLRTYLVMCGFFVLLNVITYVGAFWAIWPILGWGIGITMQAMSLYGPLADPEDVHPREENKGTPLADPDERMELRELETRRPYRDEDLV